jgi:hypothetical protein
MQRLILPFLLGASLLGVASDTSAQAQTVPPQITCAAAPVPPGSTLSLIASRIAVNGLPMSIVQATSALPVATFMQFYARAWVSPQGKPLYVRYPLGPWQVIAHGANGCFYTVQAQQQRGSTSALIGVSMPQRSQRNADLIDITAPANARVITHMVSEDSGKLGNTWLLYTANPPDAVVRFYARALRARGWAQVMQQSLQARPGVTSAMYAKGASNIGLVVQPMRAGSSITITEMTH